jgi:FSR family fosmidomycin resistance protein-like MFS transporter
LSKTGFSPLLILGHAVNDTFSNLLSGLLPVLTIAFSLSYLLAGLTAMVFNMTSSILQPLLGRWFDRTQTTWLLEAGLAVNCVGMSFVGVSPNFVILLFLVGSAGLGSAAFHPPAFSTIVHSSGSSRGAAMAIFLSGGNTGFFLGPIVAGLIVSSMGLRGTLLLLPIGLSVAILLLTVRDLSYHSEQPKRGKVAVMQPANRRLVALLATITAFRSITIQTAVTFLPLYFVVTGEPLFIATVIASIWLGVGVLGQIAGGFISDRVGSKPVIVTSLFAGGILFQGFLFTSGALSLFLLALSGAVLYASWSVIVVMSSDAAPDNVGAVSGLMLGFSIGIGGLAALGFGAVADLVGLHYGFVLFSAFAFAGGLAAILLPKQLQIGSSTQP